MRKRTKLSQKTYTQEHSKGIQGKRKNARHPKMYKCLKSKMKIGPEEGVKNDHKDNVELGDPLPPKRKYVSERCVHLPERLH